jgi:acyl-CoA synthetase (NDP forming)
LITNSATLARQMLHTVRAAGLLSDGEPVVVPAEGHPDDFAAAVRAALAAEDCASVVCAVVNAFEDGTGAAKAQLEALAADAGKPVIAVLLDFHTPAQDSDGIDRVGGLPVFDSPVDPIRALSALTAYAHWRERDPGAVPLLEVDEEAARRLVNKILTPESRSHELTDAESAELLSAYGIHPVPKFPVSSVEEAVGVAERLGWNVVLKATAERVRGRPDLASVHRNIDDPEEMAEAWKDLGALLEQLGLEAAPDLALAAPVVQAMSPPGVALVVTSQEDAAFGPIISVGLDGIASELLGDTVYRVPPLTTVDAAGMVRDLRAAPTLFGRHGSPGVDVVAVEDLLHRVSQLADDLPQLASVTLSPVVVSRSGLSVLGAHAVIAPTGDHRDPMARIL